MGLALITGLACIMQRSINAVTRLFLIRAKPTAVFCGMNMDHQAQELKLCTYSPVGGFTVTIPFTLLSSTTGGMLTTTRMIIS